MYLLLVVLQALCELINDLRRTPQLEPVRRLPDESDGSSGHETRRPEPSRCSSYDAAPRLTRQIMRSLRFDGGRARTDCRPGSFLRWRRRF